METFDEYRLGEQRELLRVTTREDCAALALAFARQAHGSLYLFTHDLDPELYNSAAFIDAARSVAGARNGGRIRILAYDIDRAVNRGHRLLDLARRLGSQVQIRQTPRSYHHSFLVADETGVFDRRRADRYEATASFNDPGWASSLRRFFDEVWDQSGRSSNAAALNL